MKLPPFLMFLVALLIIATSVQAVNVEVQNVPAGSRASKLWQSAEPSKVKIGGEMGRRIDITIDSHLLKLDFEKLYFVDYRAKKRRRGNFIGLGMLLDAVVGFADYRRDEEMINLKNRLIDETLKTQTEDGYIGIMRPDSRIMKEWDIHSAGHLVIGLVHDYRVFGQKRSLDAAVRLCDYIAKGWTAKGGRDPGVMGLSRTVVTTDFSIACVALYQETGEQRFKDYLTNLSRIYEWDGRIRQGRWQKAEGHAYAHLSMCLSQLHLDLLKPDPRLRIASEKLKPFLIEDDGAAIVGAISFWECWHTTQDFSSKFGETCANAYLLRWCDELIRQEHNPIWGHVMERTIYNALCAAQSPDGRHIRYYINLEGPRAYYPLDSFCCPSNFRRVISELPKYVYYTTNDGGVTVNQYTASEVTLSLGKTKTVKLTQETNYPNSGKITLHVEPSQPGKFPIRLRIPSWCDKPEVAVNGQKLNALLDSKAWCMLDRDWAAGDRVELNFPMRWRWIRGRKAQSGRVALMRGPLVFALNRELNRKSLGDRIVKDIVIDINSVTGPMPDASARPDGLACTVKAWSKDLNYPMDSTDMTLTLTEIADPGSTQTYLKLASPEQPGHEDDELFGVKFE